jgi:hypothetical protein
MLAMAEMKALTETFAHGLMHTNYGIEHISTATAISPAPVALQQVAARSITS